MHPFTQSAGHRGGNGRGSLRAMAMALSLLFAGCASSGTPDAQKQSGGRLTDVFASPDWARFTGAERKTQARTVTPDDLIGADGLCASTRVAVAEPESPPAEDGAPSGAFPIVPTPVDPAQAGPTVAGGIALAMTECEVAQRAGYPTQVNIGAEGNERSAVLTYLQGPWPGIYRFREGRLVSIERVEIPEPPKPKKPARPQRQSKPPLRTSQPR